MMTCSPMATSESYYDHDDYYADKDGAVAEARSEWIGKGAEALGLRGAVAADMQKAVMIEGRLPNGEAIGRGGTHKRATDVTLSAPKSFSIMAQHDPRLNDAFREAVRATAEKIEATKITTRVTENGVVRQERTGSMVAAVHYHETSRDGMMQKHAHLLTANASQRADGSWAATDSRSIYLSQKEIGLILRQELEARCAALGHQLEADKAGRDPSFRFAAVSREMERAFSPGSKRVEARLEKSGLTRATASAAEKETANKATRANKQSFDLVERKQAWSAIEAAHGFDGARVAAAAQAQSAQPGHAARVVTESTNAASHAVTTATAALAEREAVFSDRSLRAAAASVAAGRGVSPQQIENAIARAEARGDLVSRTMPAGRFDAGKAAYTTPTAITVERQILATELQQRGTVTPLAGHAEAWATVRAADQASQAQGYATWNEGQKCSTVSMLTSPNRFSAVNGVAGAAKSTTAMATVARAAEACGETVYAMAPSDRQAKDFGGALGGREVSNLAAFLVRAEAAPAGSMQGTWLVNEAGQIGAADMDRLQQSACA